MGSDPSAAADGCLLEVINVSKAFPGVLALENVSLRLRCGTVHAVVGENGAGKSTLMNIIAGLHAPDRGELRLRGRPLRLRSPREALESGIAMIHQELNLMPSMSVAENIWIGREPVNACGVISHRELHRRTRELLGSLSIDIDPQAPLRSLSIAYRQMVEIAKAISYDSQLLIMDEPTSALTERDAERLFRDHSRPEGAAQRHPLHQPPDRGALQRGGRDLGTARRPACRHRQSRQPHPRADHPHDGRPRAGADRPGRTGASGRGAVGRA